MVYSGYGDVEVIASNLGISLYFIKNRLQLKLDLLRAVRELMPLSAVLMRAYAVDGHWAESVHLRMYTNLKPKSPPDKLTQFQRIVLTIH